MQNIRVLHVYRVSSLCTHSNRNRNAESDGMEVKKSIALPLLCMLNSLLVWYEGRDRESCTQVEG